MMILKLKQKLIKVFIIKYFWVFWYNAPNEDKKYQQKIKKANPKVINNKTLYKYPYFYIFDFTDEEICLIFGDKKRKNSKK